MFPVVGIYHMDYIEELFESIEIQLVFHRFPISRSMAFIDASDEEQAVFMGHDALIFVVVKLISHHHLSRFGYFRIENGIVRVEQLVFLSVHVN